MEATETTHRSSFFGLIGHWRQEVMRLIRQEIQLAKAEMMEKVSKMMRNAIYAAAGGIVALIGAELLFLGIGVIAGYGFTKLGWEPGLAYAAGIGGVGILVAIIGMAFLMKGIKAFNAKVSHRNRLSTPCANSPAKDPRRRSTSKKRRRQTQRQWASQEP